VRNAKNMKLSFSSKNRRMPKRK